MSFRSSSPPPPPYSGPQAPPPVPSWAVGTEPAAPAGPSPAHRARTSHRRRRRGPRVPDRYERVLSSVTTAAAAVAVLTLAGEVRPVTSRPADTGPGVCDPAPRSGTEAERTAPPRRHPARGRGPTTALGPLTGHYTG